MVRKVEELQCWQLADTLRSEVYAICAQKRVAAHYKFCAGFRDAASSVCRNLGEGFDRNTSPQIVQFCGYALGSLGELNQYFKDCVGMGFIDQDRLIELQELVEHAKAKTIKFKQYHERKAKRRPTPRQRPASGFSYTPRPHSSPETW